MGSRRHRVDVFLPPGALVVRSGDVSIKTIVGSCVAICLWDRTKQFGGVNHYLLPRPMPGDPPDRRFGTIAIADLVEKMRRGGARLGRLQASVIGGGSPVGAVTAGSVGDQNTRVALERLTHYGISISRQETGGDHGRKLLFNTSTGVLIVRHVRGCNEINAAKGVAS